MNRSLLGTIRGATVVRAMKSTVRVAGIMVVGAAILSAAPIPNGAVMVSLDNGTVKHFTPAGALVQTLTGGSSYMTGSIFDAAGNFFVTNFAGNVVKKYDNNGVFVSNTAGVGSSPESIVFNAAGEYIVGAVGGGLRRFSATDVLLETDLAATRIDWFDLAADQQVVYYTQEGRTIQPYNLVTNTAGTTIILPGGGSAYAIRLLPGGGMVVADGFDIKRLNAAGALVQTYDQAGIDDWFALNLDPDGVTFWSAGIAGGKVRRFNLASGAVVGSFDATGFVYGLSVRGEIAVGDGRCDVNTDSRIDSLDINAIMAARNQASSGPTDPRDFDRNGTITVTDARACTRICTDALCATQAAR
jgi:WD40 repeat protein